MGIRTPATSVVTTRKVTGPGVTDTAASKAQPCPDPLSRRLCSAHHEQSWIDTYEPVVRPVSDGRLEFTPLRLQHDTVAVSTGSQQFGRSVTRHLMLPNPRTEQLAVSTILAMAYLKVTLDPCWFCGREHLPTWVPECA